MVNAQTSGILKLGLLAQRLKSFDKEVRIFAEYVLNQQKYKDVLIAYNLYNLNQGIRPDGSQIEKTPTGRQQSTRYERYTAYLKSKRGDLKDIDSPVDLEGETGNLRASLDIKIGSDRIYFINRDIKSEIIESIWGQVWGITEDQLFEFVELITPEFNKFCRKHFTLE